MLSRRGFALGPSGWMAHVARSATRRPGRHLAFWAVVVTVLAAGLPRLELRTDGAAMRDPRGPIHLRTLEERDHFGDGDEALILATNRVEGLRLDSVEGVAALLAWHRELAAVAGVAAVRSAATVAASPSRGQVVPRPYLEGFEELDPRAARDAVLALRRHPAVDGLYLSADGQAALLRVERDPSTPRRQWIEGLEHWIAGHGSSPDQTSPWQLRLTGPPVAEVRLGDRILEDLGRLIPVSMLLCAGLLWLCLRCLWGVLIPLLEVALVLVSTIGLMGWMGVPLSLTTTVLPVLLLTLSITDEVHLLEAFARHRTGGLPARRAAERAIEEVGWPVVWTSITTAVGCASFLGASIPTIRHLGLFAALGVLLAMVLTFSLVPALLVLLPPRGWPAAPQPSGEGMLWAHERWVLHHPRAAFAAVAAVVVLAGLGLGRLEVQDDWARQFDPRSDLVTAFRDIDQRFWGAYTHDVIVRFPRAEQGRLPRDAFHPDSLRRLEAIEASALEQPGVGGVLSPLTVVRAMAEARGLPERASLVPYHDLRNLRVLGRRFEEELQLRHLLADDAHTARLRLFVHGPDRQGIRYREAAGLYRDLEEALGRHLDPTIAAGTTAGQSGELPMASETVATVVRDQLRSWLVTLGLVAGVLGVALGWRGSPWAAWAPILGAPVTVLGAYGLGAHGAFGPGGPAAASGELGVATSLFGALTVGVGVDFALHTLHAHARQARDLPARGSSAALSEPAVVAWQRVLATTGRAVRWNMAVLAGGFSVLAFSVLLPNRLLGALLAAAMVASYVCTLAFTPPLTRRRASCPRQSYRL
ncbi:MAG: MMPL family transporter [Holophagales bacterium]|nr:MMPL family transporter [Holophagales bacterium]